MKGFYVSASGAIQGHHGPLLILLFLAWGGGLLVVLQFNATLTAKIISWRSVTHMCFLGFSHQN